MPPPTPACPFPALASRPMFQHLRWVAASGWSGSREMKRSKPPTPATQSTWSSLGSAPQEVGRTHKSSSGLGVM